MPLREDDVAARTGVPPRRILLQAGGFVLALAATLAVFLTDNPQVLRLAVVGVAWAFVLATVAASSRSADRAAARAREDRLRQAYEHELDLEAAGRREHELELEAELRREAQESMRAELDALRHELAGLTGLRDEVARVAGLRTDLAALSALRDEVARVAALRDDVAALTGLRQELGQLAELRDDMGRLRQELTEQLSSEMLVERIVMRTQASRLTSDVQDAPGRALDAGRWNEESPPRELTGGWPAVRLDEPRETRQFEQVRVERTVRPPLPPLPVPPVARPVPAPSWRPSWESGPDRAREAPGTSAWGSLPSPSRETPAASAWESPATSSWEPPATSAWEPVRPPEAWSGPAEHRWAPAPLDEDTPLWSATAHDTAENTRHDAAPPTTSFPLAAPAAGNRPAPVPPASTPEPLPSPLEWLAARSMIDAEPTSSRPEVPPRRRRGDEPVGDPAVARTTQRPAVRADPPVRIDDRGGYRVAVPAEPPAGPPPAQEKRLADILAENGVSPATGGRRRRRYRDDDESDDVLARVLGNG
ncbi:DUF6779 domain-containing protein [Blastococcus tunisiensis]|uniref:DUF6779 domain-containing protein n=1 Tax=Blastococcus tunisiensis TaxID=1798228 RepID=A0A1I1XW08_9ACTN|nr:DUF6779 domain-containing protein [Blastococcus sp. DSM 46838]SFE11484.1 hypothetical protein SAMN05216574_102190 [Blastococcus sp. DSM 46838]